MKTKKLWQNTFLLLIEKGMSHNTALDIADKTIERYKKVSNNTTVEIRGSDLQLLVDRNKERGN